MLIWTSLAAATVHYASSHNTLQDAVDFAHAGDTILLEAGSYDSIVVDKSLILVGAGPEFALVSSPGGPAIAFTGVGSLELEGLTVAGDSTTPAIELGLASATLWDVDVTLGVPGISTMASLSLYGVNFSSNLPGSLGAPSHIDMLGGSLIMDDVRMIGSGPVALDAANLTSFLAVDWLVDAAGSSTVEAPDCELLRSSFLCSDLVELRCDTSTVGATLLQQTALVATGDLDAQHLTSNHAPGDHAVEVGGGLTLRDSVVVGHSGLSALDASSYQIQTTLAFDNAVNASSSTAFDHPSNLFADPGLSPGCSVVDGQPSGSWAGAGLATDTNPDGTAGDLGFTGGPDADLAIYDLDGDGYVGADDCDEGDPETYVGAPEQCNGKDNDCQGAPDDNIPGALYVLYYADEDGDGFGNPGITQLLCDQGEGWSANNVDCDDSDAGVNPGIDPALENPGSGIDLNCDGITLSLSNEDVDGDGYCPAYECVDPTILPGDCNDADPAIYVGASEVCNGEDDDCDGIVDDGISWDFDQDGKTSVESCLGTADDCEDFIASANPDQPEVACNGIDDDCDGVVDDPSAYIDSDGDGYRAPGSCGFGVEDCDDSDAAVRPFAPEIPDNDLDDDCDGTVDEELPRGSDNDGDGFCVDPCDDGVSPGGDCDDTNPSVNVLMPESPHDGVDNNCDGRVDEATDADGDGVFTPEDCDDLDAERPRAEVCNGIDDDCDGIVEPGEFVDDDNDGVAACNDCDDSNPLVKPGIAENCGDGIDNNCDGVVDEDADADADGYTTCEGDCNDADPSVHPFAVEVCNELDDNCNGLADETGDLDGDGVRGCEGACPPPEGEACDCDDLNRYINPNLPEICDDGYDNDCNGLADADDLDAFIDNDFDGFTECEGDCDDTSRLAMLISPASVEVCDLRDNNCNGLIDENLDLDGDGFTCATGDCDDTSFETNLVRGVDDTCNGLDEDCNLIVDDGFSDADGDGYICDDCAPDNAEVHPDRAEVCDNGIDDDCDELVDISDEECEVETTEPTTSGPGSAVEKVVDLPRGWFCSSTGAPMSLWWGPFLLLGVRRARS